MNKNIYQQLESWFFDYTESYLKMPNADVENVLLKKQHTLRVCANMKLLTECFIPEVQFLGLTTALFHDIGRFEQLRIYNTFSDFKSEDHASMGVRILKELGILKKLEPEHIEVILTAINNHNKAQIECGLSDQTRLICELIRDADKLDIWQVVIEYYKDGREKDNPALVHNLPKGSDVSLTVFDAIKNREVIPYHLLQSIIDFKLLQMAWIYDINSSKTHELIQSRSYLEAIAKTLPQTANIKFLCNRMLNLNVVV